MQWCVPSKNAEFFIGYRPLENLLAQFKSATISCFAKKFLFAEIHAPVFIQLAEVRVSKVFDIPDSFSR